MPETSGGLHAYPYLLASVGMAAVAGAMIWLLASQRRLLVTSGLLCVPYGLLSFEFIPAYWDPPVVVHWIASPEDLIFSGSTGVISMYFAVLPWRHRLQWSIRIRRAVVHYAGYTALLVGVMLLVKLATRNQRNVMEAALAGMAAVGACILYQRREFVRLGTIACLGFTLFHAVVILITAAFWPHFLNSWRTHDSINVCSVPVFELLWAAAYGFTWPMCLANVLDAHFCRAIGNRHDAVGC